MNNKLVKALSVFMYVFCLIVLFNATFRFSWAFDIGWQLRNGEYIVKNHAVQWENTFSYEMAGYKWVDSSWSLDAIRYLLFTKWGFMGFAVLQSILVVVTTWFFAKGADLNYWELTGVTLLLLIFEMPIYDAGFTGQSISFLGMGILYLLLNKIQKGSRIAFFLIVPLFLIWVNIHGEFFLGFLIFGLWSGVYILAEAFESGKFEFVRGKVAAIKMIPLVVVTFVATWFNPYGLFLYSDILKHAGTPMQKVITEWFPFETFSFSWWQLVVWGIFILINISIIVFREESLKKLPFIAPFVILYIMSFFMRRYAWAMYLISIPLCYQIFSISKPKNEWIRLVVSAMVVGGMYMYVFYKIIPAIQLDTMNWDQYCQYSGCTYNAGDFFSNYVKVNKIPPSQYMTTYDWGGWLIWNYPSIKPTVDGRMPLWVDERGYSGFEKYYKYETNVYDVNNSNYNLVYMAKSKPLYRRLYQLVAEKKWRTLYEDDSNIIAERVTYKKFDPFFQPTDVKYLAPSR